MNAINLNAIGWTPLVWTLITCLIGGVLSVAFAALFALNAQRKYVPLLVSYAIGALLGAVFLEILPHAITIASTPMVATATVLAGILLFFILEKLVLWRHCHGEHCEAHAMHDAGHCPQPSTKHKYKPVSHTTPSIIAKMPQSHTDESGRSATMIMIGDSFHNFVDGILIAAAFMVDIKLGLLTAIAMIVHEIPQEVGDFLILLHSGYSKQKALLFNLFSSFATLVGGMLAFYALQMLQSWVPYILCLAAASMLYVAVADLIPDLHKRTAMRETVAQIVLILLGVGTILFTQWLLEA